MPCSSSWSSLLSWSWAGHKIIIFAGKKWYHFAQNWQNITSVNVCKLLHFSSTVWSAFSTKVMSMKSTKFYASKDFWQTSLSKKGINFLCHAWLDFGKTNSFFFNIRRSAESWHIALCSIFWCGQESFNHSSWICSLSWDFQAGRKLEGGGETGVLCFWGGQT